MNGGAEAANAARSRPSAVIIGPGRIGCGYLAPLFRRAGWRTVMAARTPASRDRILARRRFEVRAGSRRQTCEVDAAVSIGDDAFEAAVAEADVILTAVGVGNVAGLARPLARALSRRGERPPVDVWVVENGDVAPVLERAVRSVVAEERLAAPAVGFAGAIAMPVVSHGSWHGDSPVFVRDDVDGLVVDERRTLRPFPAIPGVAVTSRYEERLREKLYGFGCGHLLLAYLGSWAGYRRLDEAARDVALSTIVRRCLLDGRRAFVRAHPELGTDVAGPVAAAIRRYRNIDLADPIRRVARNPMRKLAADGPLLGPAALVRDMLGHESRALALGAATVLLYRDEEDEQAVELSARLAASPAERVLADVSGLPARDPIVAAAARAYRRLRRLARLQPGPLAPAPVRARARPRNPLVFVSL